MAHIVSTAQSSGDRVWIDTYGWNFYLVSDQTHLRVASLSSTHIDFAVNYDPYALVSVPNPAWGGLSFNGVGFAGEDLSGFPTQGTVTDVVLTSPLNGVQLSITGLSLPVSPLIVAFRNGNTRDAAALLTGGDDVFEGGSVNNNPNGIWLSDAINSGPGDDTIIGHGGADVMRGGEGDDLFVLTGERAEVDGNAGLNTVSFQDASGAIAVDFTDPQNNTSYLTNIQRVVGGPFGDSLTGGSGADTFTSGGGADTIKGGGGADVIVADGTSADPSVHTVLWGGDGDDLIQGDVGFNQVNGNTGQDSIVGRSTIGDWLLGGQGDDQIDATASSGHNVVNGNLGDDTLHGGTGGDTLRGGQGDDSITASSGSNWISGDLGRNTLMGGAGADDFHAGAGQDVIVNFNAQAGDRVLVDAGVHYTVQQTAADVTITFDNAGQMVLRGVQAVALPNGWIIG